MSGNSRSKFRTNGSTRGLLNTVATSLSAIHSNCGQRFQHRTATMKRDNHLSDVGLNGINSQRKFDHTSIRVDGEYVRSATHRRDSHPATVFVERYILHL